MKCPETNFKNRDKNVLKPAFLYILLRKQKLFKGQTNYIKSKSRLQVLDQKAEEFWLFSLKFVDKPRLFCLQTQQYRTDF